MANSTYQEQHKKLLEILRVRFENHIFRHPDLLWHEIENKLEKMPQKLSSLSAMEESGGEPDVIGKDVSTGEFIFCDCSKESPKGRRSICYDREALNARKEHKPSNSASDLAAEMGIEILTEEQYKFLQRLGPFDLKTSSWLQTPEQIRKSGGAIFGDCRYNHVFIYHNGAESYYAARGFRGILKV